MNSDLSFLVRLEAIIDQRRTQRPAGSYVTRLFDSGPRKIAQKIGEEGVELALACAGTDRREIVSEAADLLFHTMVALRQFGLSLSDVTQELARRHPD